MPDSQPPAGAIFLSYAREDSESARRIADGLRAFGVEVWFDQSELRGGDAWDAKIKTQIRTCSLFLPIISAQTQKRTEGYFRREWKIGVERTHDMAAGRAFIVPVVVDETRESEAFVPEEFMRVQWSRVTHGVPTPQFVEQIKGLLANPHRHQSREREAPESGAPASATSKPKGLGWIAAAAVGAAAVGAFLYFWRANPVPAVIAPTPVPAVARAVDSKSVAVLPFANFSPDKDNEFFADGLQDEVITALAKIHDLKVISRTSVLAYRNPDGRNLKKIGEELGVATVLEGSVQRVGSQVHLNVQLIDARTDDHLWADSYTENLTDVFSLESALAQRIATALNAGLTSDEKALIDRRPTQNQEAYDLYLRGRILTEAISPTGDAAEFDRVIGVYEQAAEKDPQFSLPHVQISILQGYLYWFSSFDPSEERKVKALAALEIARRLAPSAPETRLAQGEYDYTCLNDWNKALGEYSAALASLPNDSQVNYGIGRALRRLGRLNEAMEKFQKASELDPNDDNSAYTVVQTLFEMHRYRETIETAQRVAARFPMDDFSRLYKSSAQFQLDGDRASFLKTFAGLNPFGDEPDVVEIRRLLEKGDFAAADKLLAGTKVASISNNTGAMSDPVSLYRAYIAYLDGRKDDARRLAQAAIKYYRDTRWTRRQLDWAAMGIAKAEAYSGDTEAAVRDARAAEDRMAAFDPYEAVFVDADLGRILVIAGHDEEALALLAQMMALPLERAPKAFPFDPIWSRLAGNPRFKQILDSVQSL